MKTDFELFKRLITEQTKGIYLSDILLVVLIALFVFLLIKVISLKTGKTMTRSKSIYIICTLIYAGILALITVFRRQPGSRVGTVHMYLDFGTLKGGWFSSRQAVYSVLNVLLFVPWGFFLRLGRKNDGFIKAVILTGLEGFLTSFCIEIIQVATSRGMFELTDLVTNITGTVIGAVLASIVIVISKKMKQDKQDE